MSLNASQALGNLPQGLRAELLQEFSQLTRDFREGRWRAQELDAGHFCEIVYWILKGYLDGGEYVEKSTKPSGFDLKTACENLAKTPKTAGPDSVRVTVPRVLVALYQIRNNRGVSHTGSEVNPNHMDATFVLHSAQWVMAELVRIYNDTDVDSATKIVDALVDRTLPVVWAVGDVKRVLDLSLSLADATLVLLYSEAGGESDTDLARHLEQTRISDYRRRVLTPLHMKRLIEWTQATGLVVISPRGTTRVETELLPKVAR